MTTRDQRLAAAAEADTGTAGDGAEATEGGAAAGAQDAGNYPVKPIRLVLAQPPGGATDIQMRLYAQKVGELLGHQIIVDNRAAGGVAGLATFSNVAAANPDGKSPRKATRCLMPFSL